MLRMIFGSVLVSILAAGVCGCGGSGDSGGANNNNSASTTSTSENVSSNSLAGGTFHFTVTSSYIFSEPVGGVYTIDFHTNNTYTFHPSPQNREEKNVKNGVYTYNANTEIIHFPRPDHQDIDGKYTFTSPTAG